MQMTIILLWERCYRIRKICCWLGGVEHICRTVWAFIISKQQLIRPGSQASRYIFNTNSCWNFSKRKYHLLENRWHFLWIILRIKIKKKIYFEKFTDLLDWEEKCIFCILENVELSVETWSPVPVLWRARIFGFSRVH